MGSNPASRATLKGLSSGKALFLFRPPPIGICGMTTVARRAFSTKRRPRRPLALAAAQMKTAAIGRRRSIAYPGKRQ
ncbi:hypothetical protein LGM59_08400 [Burkholderia metallica]|nr:hypothetical protein [Burkholderia metallica]